MSHEGKNKGGGGGIKAHGIHQPWFKSNFKKRRAKKIAARKARKKNR